MEIIIGRTLQEKKLLLTVDGKDQPTSVSVPASVGTQHCKLTIKDGQIHLRNLDINNYTYVNGRIVESKIVSQNDKIEFGTDRYKFDWSVLSQFLPTDISHLKQVWDEYENDNLALMIKERKFNAIRSATSIFTMIAGLISVRILTHI